MSEEDVHSTKVTGSKEKTDKLYELRKKGYSIVGENDNGNGTFTIFYREKDK
jgi:hypothetical protein